jgi:hypothetical protein
MVLSRFCSTLRSTLSSAIPTSSGNGRSVLRSWAVNRTTTHQKTTLFACAPMSCADVWTAISLPRGVMNRW